jgi:hypothetical protein
MLAAPLPFRPTPAICVGTERERRSPDDEQKRRSVPPNVAFLPHMFSMPGAHRMSTRYLRVPTDAPNVPCTLPRLQRNHRSRGRSQP